MESKKIFNIQSGEMRVASSGLMSIVLGSCIAVVIFDKKLKIGGANHFLLSTRGQTTQPSDLTPLHFGDEAIVLLLKEFKSRGSFPKDLIVKIVGGANELGQTNIAIAEKTLLKFNIPIENRSVGGELARKVHFDPATGDLKCKLFPIQDNILTSPKVEVVTSFQKAIKVLIVDDSKPIRMILRSIYSNDPRFEVIGEANHPLEAEEIRKKCEPDLMTLDIQMPYQDGVSYLQSLMKPLPFAVVVITDFGAAQGGPVVSAMELGAFHYFQKPSLNEVTELGEKIRETSLHAVEALRKKQMPSRARRNSLRALKPPSMIVIGSSTGGTEVVKEILVSLPEDCPPGLVAYYLLDTNKYRRAS